MKFNLVACTFPTSKKVPFGSYKVRLFTWKRETGTTYTVDHQNCDRFKKNNRLAHSVYVRSSFSYKGVFNQQFSPIVSTSWPFLSGYRSSYSPNILSIASGRSGIIIQNNKQGMKHVCTSQSTHFPQCIMSLQSLMAKRIFSPLLSYKNSFLRNLSRPT